MGRDDCLAFKLKKLSKKQDATHGHNKRGMGRVC